MQRIIITILSAFFIFSPIIGQETKSDTLRFDQDSINSVYIPKDINDCFSQLDGYLNDSIKNEIRSRSEQEFSTISHFGLGLWIRNNWQLWGGSRLSKYFNKMGIFHPDDMSGIINKSYHRYLLNSDLKLNEQIQYYIDYWAKTQIEENEQNKEFNEYTIGDTLTYNYLYGFASSKQEKDFLTEKCIATGVIVKKDEIHFLIYVQLIKSCGKKGIISSDNKMTLEYNKTKEKYDKPALRKVGYLKIGESEWFDYLNWELQKK